MAAPHYVFIETDGPEGTLYQVVDGTEGNDWLVGTPRNELFHGKGGDDVIFGEDPGVFGLGSADRIYGGAGNDWLYGNLGDRLIGGPGDDSIQTTGARSQGGLGNDWIATHLFWDGPSLSEVNGGAGADRFEFDLINTVAGFFDPNLPALGRGEIEDFKRAQGDHIKLDAWDGAEITPRQVFNRLDTDHNHRLNMHDGESQFGSVTRDGDSLNLRYGQLEVDVDHVAQLQINDFLFF